jgi:hypothetical protein
MSYRDQLKNRIRELELEITNKTDRKDVLEKELQDLMRKEFEEDLREESNRKSLLQG